MVRDGGEGKGKGNGDRNEFTGAASAASKGRTKQKHSSQRKQGAEKAKKKPPQVHVKEGGEEVAMGQGVVASAASQLLG